MAGLSPSCIVSLCRSLEGQRDTLLLLGLPLFLAVTGLSMALALPSRHAVIADSLQGHPIPFTLSLSLLAVTRLQKVPATQAEADRQRGRHAGGRGVASHGHGAHRGE